MELLTKPIPQGQISPFPSGGRPLKVPKPNDEPSSKAALKKQKQQKQNQQPLTKYIAMGEIWKPYREFGYKKRKAHRPKF